MRRVTRLSVLIACASVAITASGVAMAVTPAPSAGEGGTGSRASERANVRSSWADVIVFSTEQDQVATPNGVRDRVDSVLVKFEGRGVSPPERREALDAAGAEPGAARRVKGLPHVWRVPVDEGASPGRVARRLAGAEEVVWAVADLPATTEVMPDDPLFPDLWGLSNTGQQVQASPPFAGLAGVDLGALGAWATTQGSSSGSVAVVDTGITMGHPDLAANLRAAGGRNFVPDAEGAIDPLAFDDVNSHGSHVAGTVGAVGDNGLGVAGVNWSVGMTPVRSCDFDGSCGYTAEGMAYAGGEARVVNVSISSLGNGQPFTDAVRRHPDSLYVVAAGNDGNDNDETPRYPCNVALPNVLCVAAIDANGGLASFSNYGATSVDIAAPGVDILSTVPNFTTAFAPAIEPDAATPPRPTGWTQDPDGQWTVEQLRNGLDYLDLVAEEGQGAPIGDDFEVWTIEAPGNFDPPGRSCRMEAYVAVDLVTGREQLQLHYFTDRAPSTPVLAGVISGDTRGGFEKWQVDLSALRGANEVQLMFAVVRATGDPARAGGEASIVNPVVRCIVDQPAGGSYGFQSGTSMAAPQVAGAAALLLAKNPTLTAAQLKRALLSTAVPMASLEGKVATGGRLDANAALASVAAAPAAATAPTAPASGTAASTPTGTATAAATLTGTVPCVGITCLATGAVPTGATRVTQQATSRPDGRTATGTCTVNRRAGTYACTLPLGPGTWVITTTAHAPSGAIASFSRQVTVAARPEPVTG